VRVRDRAPITAVALEVWVMVLVISRSGLRRGANIQANRHHTAIPMPKYAIREEAAWLREAAAAKLLAIIRVDTCRNLIFHRPTEN